MQVFIYGFSLEFAKAPSVPQADFARWLEKMDWRNGDRHIAGTAVQCGARGMVAGVILHDKRNKHIAVRTEPSAGKIRVEPQALANGGSAVDVNFFVLDVGTWRGLYQQYHQSTSLVQFLQVMNDCYREANIGAKKESSGVVGHILVPPGSMAEIVSRFKNVKAFEFSIEELEFRDSDMEALKFLASRRRNKLVFLPKGPQSRIVAAVAGVLRRKERFKSARVKGISELGFEQTVAMDDIPQRLGSDDFDTWVKQLELDSTDWAASLIESAPIKRLIELAQRPNIAALLTKPAEP